MSGEKDRWEIYTDKRGAHRWRRKATNGQVTGRSCQGYVKKADCEANAQRHGKNGNPKKLGGSDRWETYKDKRGEFRWRRTATNGEITGTASEGYTKKADCEANAKRNGKA